MRYTVASLQLVSAHREAVDSVLLPAVTLSFQPELAAEGLAFLRFLTWAEEIEERLTGRLLLLPPAIQYAPHRSSHDGLEQHEKIAIHRTIMLLQEYFSYIFIWALDDRTHAAYQLTVQENLTTEKLHQNIVLLTNIQDRQELYQSILDAWYAAL
ncbi:MAG: hypothetical protein BSOLF_2896 [Candidatus Carbobacillus altaicus]|uniref:Uncharacterized protein n=1 Tax=Candidatus Carbonibacillus altaicus TaxID=2163959 RepID=A0A2R6Y1R6_9BACL|nr:MAG: hypothetical protein BSOLF_2896 [Candidatus Carbobacillus altaicus]